MFESSCGITRGSARCCNGGSQVGRCKMCGGSAAQIIESVIGKTIYQLHFLHISITLAP